MPVRPPIAIELITDGCSLIDLGVPEVARRDRKRPSFIESTRCFFRSLLRVARFAFSVRNGETPDGSVIRFVRFSRKATPRDRWRSQLARAKVGHFPNRYHYPSGSWWDGREERSASNGNEVKAIPESPGNRPSPPWIRSYIPAARSQALEVSTAVAARNTARN